MPTEVKNTGYKPFSMRNNKHYCVKGIKGATTVYVFIPELTMEQYGLTESSIRTIYRLLSYYTTIKKTVRYIK